jgi:hypothetical protein
LGSAGGRKGVAFTGAEHEAFHHPIRTRAAAC